MRKKFRSFCGKVAGGLKSAIKRVVKLMFDFWLATAVLLSILFLAAMTPQIHNQWIRHAVGSKVYKIQDTIPGGGGTGFAVKAPSGQSYILTNEHVCGVSADDTVLVIDNEGNSMPRRIIQRSDKTDLCIIEGMPGVEGLSVGEEPMLGDTINTIGYPRLRPLSLSYGEVVGLKDVKILDFVMKSGDPMLDMMTNAEDKACDKAKNEIVEVEVFVFGQPAGKLKLCLVVTKDAVMTTSLIHPGNSGSPVVDYWGRVVAVAFAVDDTSWGYMVNNKQLKEFLSRY